MPRAVGWTCTWISRRVDGSSVRSVALEVARPTTPLRRAGVISTSSSTRVVLDPDRQVQESVRLLFQTFRRVGSAHGTVKAYREQGLDFPTRPHSGPRKGELVWRSLTSARVGNVLHNPRYAGAYAYGRRRRGAHALEGWQPHNTRDTNGLHRRGVWCVTFGVTLVSTMLTPTPGFAVPQMRMGSTVRARLLPKPV